MYDENFGVKKGIHYEMATNVTREFISIIQDKKNKIKIKKCEKHTIMRLILHL